MKKVISMMAIAAFMFSVNGFAQEKQDKKQDKAKTEKTCSAAEKKECSKDKKAGCCAAKKMEDKK
jgi:hypothetical protein